MYGTLSAKSSPSSVGGTTPGKKIIAPPPPSARELFPQEEDVPVHGPPKPPRSPALTKVHPHPSPSSPGGSVALKRKDRRAPAPPQAATPRSGRTSPTDTINSDSLSVSSFGAQSQTVQGQEGKLWLWEVCWSFYVAGLSVLLLFLLILIFYVYKKNEKFWACIALTCVIFVFVLQTAVSLACSWFFVLGLPPPDQDEVLSWKMQKDLKNHSNKMNGTADQLAPPKPARAPQVVKNLGGVGGWCLLAWAFWDLCTLSFYFFSFLFSFLFFCSSVEILVLAVYVARVLCFFMHLLVVKFSYLLL